MDLHATSHSPASTNTAIPKNCTSTKNFFLRFQEFKDLLDEDKLCGVPVLVFANKQDLLNAKSPAEVR